jgi:mannose-6-phosphate isomerase
MTAVRLTTRTIEKIWGRHQLGLGFDEVPRGDQPVGEIWFETPGGTAPELLVKYLFTSAKLSVQVHPDDTQAQARGHARGKEECWLILDAEADAKIGIGLAETVDKDALRAAALDGSIEQLLDWRPVAPGDVFYLPAGTVHAIGAGVTLLEVQQNTDLTYRLYDYGRPRALHLDDAADVATRGPWHAPEAPGEIATGRTVLASGRKFVLEQWSGSHAGRLGPPDSGPYWLIPLKGSGNIDGHEATPGSVWYAPDTATIDYSGTLLIAYPGGKVAPQLLEVR